MMKTTFLAGLALIAGSGNAGATTLAQTAPSAAGADWPPANYDYANTRAATNSSIGMKLSVDGAPRAMTQALT